MTTEGRGGIKASGSGRWLPVAVVIHIVLASLLTSTPVRADESLQVSLQYSILSGAYNNTVQVGSIWNPKLAIDRDPASPFYGNIYAIGIGSNVQCNYSENRQLEVARSVDGGQTFSKLSLPPLCLGQTIDAAVGRNGVLFVASASGIFRSVDGGQSWNTAWGVGAESISADNATGDIYVGWIDSSGTLHVSSTRDGGSSWSNPVNVSDAEPYTIPQIAAYRSSVVVAFVRNEIFPDCFCAGATVAASQDGGLTWPYVTALSRDVVSPPSADVSPSGIFGVSWSKQEGSNTSTFVSVSSDGGRIFSKPVQSGAVSGVAAPSAYGHALAFDDASRLYVAWHSAPNYSIPSTDPNYSVSIYVAISPDYGKSFENASFTVTMTGPGANGTIVQSLAPGPNDTMFLIWGGYFEGKALVRTVSGQAKGEIALANQLASGTSVELVLQDQLTAAVQARVPWKGSTVVLDGLPPSVYDVWIDVGNVSALAGAMPVRTWNSTAFTVHVQGGPSGPAPPPFPWITAAAVGGVVLFAAAALVALQHTRLAREEVLQRKVRLLIYEAVREHPGSSFTEVRDAIGLQNGVAAYHLSVLEKQGLVHTEKGRRHRWYYPNGDASLWRDLPLSPLQRSLVERVRQAPGIGIRELARGVNRHHASVAYNVKGLAREGLLRTERAGRKVQCFPTDESGTA